jgi:LPXTG-site transpeptidase (sortase) family protein
MNAVKTTATLVWATKRAYSRKWTFLVAFLLILLLTVRVCVAVGFIPNDTSDVNVTTTTTTSTNSSLMVGPLAAFTTAPAEPTADTNTGARSTGTAAHIDGALNMNGELPTKVVISSIGLSAKIANPATTDVNALDQYLLSGAARYPTSATLDQQGNVILFGHSSYLPVVINKAFKTFDGIQKLRVGDTITIYSSTHVFTYAVTNVQQQNATTDSIPLTTTGHTLTLATCDSFGTKSDRFVVTATLVSSSPLGS